MSLTQFTQQDKLDEKSHQVEMMYDIYGNAERVCIWLGKEDDESKKAIKFIKKNIRRLRKFDELCNNGNESSNWAALLKLMQRPWFSRRWVVQEIALAKKATIYCGWDCIPWKDFAVAVELFVEVETATHRLSEVIKEGERHIIPGWFEHVSALGASLLVDATERLFREYKEEGRSRRLETASKFSDGESEDNSDEETLLKGKKPVESQWDDTSKVKNRPMQPLLSLEYLVSTLTIFETSVPHDTIYALLAIAKDTTPSSIDSELPQAIRHARAGLEPFTQRKMYRVDYKLHYVDVCKEFIKFVIERSLQYDRSRALDVICRPWATKQKKLAKQKQQVLQNRIKEEEERTLSKISQYDEQKERPKADQAGKLARCPTVPSKALSTYEFVTIEDSSSEKTNQAPDNDVENRSTGLKDLDLPSWVPQLSNATYGMSHLAGMEGLRMNRRNADPLVGFPSLTQKSYSAAETKGVDIKSLKFRRRTELDHFSMYIRGFIMDEVDHVEPASRNGQIPKE